MQPPRLPAKKDCALELLEQTSLFIHLDPRASGVMVPQWFRKQPHLVLQVGLNMAVPIHDLRVEEEGVSCTLSFNRSPFFCVMPWNAIFALSGDDGRGVVWPDEVPIEVAPQFGVARRPDAPATPAKAPHLRAVQTDAPAPRKTTATTTAKKAAKKPADKTPAKIAARKPTKNGAALADAPIRSAPKASPVMAAAAVEAPPPTPSKREGGKTPVAAGAPRKRELPPYLRVVK
jgi:stringent starvation protein B